jgi:hypothetical protein
MFSKKLGWHPIDTAPIDEDVMLFVTDGHGEPYAISNPFKLTAAGWVSSGKRTPLAVTLLMWKPYTPSPQKKMTLRRPLRVDGGGWWADGLHAPRGP